MSLKAIYIDGLYSGVTRPDLDGRKMNLPEGWVLYTVSTDIPPFAFDPATQLLGPLERIENHERRTVRFRQTVIPLFS